jgi:predicted nucleic acid-binding protein
MKSPAQKPRVYIETTIISYFTSKPSNDLLVLSRQRITEEWWTKKLPELDCYISQAVLDEISRGDKAAASRRLKMVSDFKLLEITPEVLKLAEHIYRKLDIPEKARTDALHIALPAVHEIEYLVSWNCKHIVNAFLKRKLHNLIGGFGYLTPEICTPPEFLENDDVA